MPTTARIALRALGVATQTAWSLGKVEWLERMRGPERRREYVAAHLPDWSAGVLRWAGISPHVLGAPPAANAGRGTLVLSNHRSPMDIPILLREFGGHVVSRADLSTWPLIGHAAQKAGTIFVNRENALSGARAIREVRRVLEAGHTVILFPEGTTHAGDEVRPFRRGLLRSMAALNLQIVPVGVAYPPGTEWNGGTFPAHIARLIARRATPVGVAIGPPLMATATDTALAEAAREAVQRMVHAARAHVEAATTRGPARDR